MNASLLKRWKLGDPAVLNLADFCPETNALGPGKRAVIWVQGCALRCPGCVSPTYQPFEPVSLIEVEELTARILQTPDLSGITISGGEPFHQAIGLSRIIDLIHEKRPELTILSYSGYTLDELKNNKRIPGINEYLSRLDSLIDGPYLRSRDNGLTGLRGSSNQVIHHFSPRLQDFDFENSIRQPEVHIQDHELVMIGIPSRRFINALDVAMNEVLQMRQSLVQNVRP
jgi:anaerobic ribonucleoside-triphosphate reductase activating protein